MSYQFNSIVSKQEADALKEVIFKRARERAEALNNEAHKNYTSSMQTEIMDLARDSFRKTINNPFVIEEKVADTSDSKKATVVEREEIGFEQKNIEEIKSRIQYRNQVAIEKISNNAIQENMLEAQADFNKNKGFMGALSFLNSQASIVLVQKRGIKFEATA